MECLNEKDLQLIADKVIKNIPDSCDAKELCRSLIIKENNKSVKQSEIIIS